MAKQIEKDLGKSARREFHDMKDPAGGDRSMHELKEAAKAVYEGTGKTPPRWMQ